MLIRPALTDEDFDHVYRLTHDAYVALDYVPPQPDGRLRHYVDIDAAPENMVVVAEKHDVIVGTVSVTLDGPAGLPSEHRFGTAVDIVRAEGHPIGACWRLVTDRRHCATDAAVLELVRATLEIFGGFGVDTVLLSLAPGHERAYNRLFNTRAISHTCKAAAEISSPLVLVRASVIQGLRRLPSRNNPALATLVAERRRLLDSLRRTAA